MDNSTPSSSANAQYIAQKALNTAKAAEDGVATINSRRAAASGFAPLDSSSQVPVANLPSTAVLNRALTLTTDASPGEGLEIVEGPALNYVVVRPKSNAGTTDVSLRLTGLGTEPVYVNGAVAATRSEVDEKSGPNRYFKAGTTNYTAYYCAGLANGVALTTKALVANRIYAVPYVAPDRGGTLDALEVYVTTGVAATNLRIGIYENAGEADLYPGTLLLDAGAFTSTTSNQKRTASISQALTPGALYWFAVVSDGAPTLRGVSNNACSHLLGTASSANTTYTSHLYANLTYGALPSTFPTAGATAATGNFPGIFCRFSA